MTTQSIVSPANSGNQLSLFSVQFDSRVRRVEINGVIHFSIFDVLEFNGSGGSATNPRVYWKNAQDKFKSQGADEVVNQVLQHQFPGAGQRKTPVAPFKFFLRLAMVIEIKEWETIRTWMADVAHERLEEMATPGLGTQRARQRDPDALGKLGLGKSAAAEFLQDRIHGVDGYKELMATVFAVCDRPEPGKIVTSEYVGLFGMIPKQLQAVLATKHIRDRLPQRQYLYLRMAESDLTDVLKMHDSLTMDELLSIVDRIVVPLGVRLRDLCDELGIDVVTGQKLIGKGK
jgi:hypothetical protein